jgi:N-methylhydantoinase B
VLRVVDADLAEYEVDAEATQREREHIRRHRRAWIEEDPQRAAERFRNGEIGVLDVVRRYAVLLDWETGAVLDRSTAQFREMFKRRSADHWQDAPAAAAAS